MADNQLKNIKVLIVDDEKSIQRLVYAVMIRLGFHFVTVANSGREAIDFLSTQPIDFVVADWRMGDLDGIDVIEFLRKSPQSPNIRMPVVLLTGNTEAHYVVRARDAGVNEYIIKPFSVEQLVKRIRSIIENPQNFVEARNYKGPDRRHREIGLPDGRDRRKRRGAHDGRQ